MLTGSYFAFKVITIGRHVKGYHYIIANLVSVRLVSVVPEDTYPGLSLIVRAFLRP